MFKTTIFRTLALALSMTAMAAVAHADNITDLPVKSLNGKNYYYYEVQPKETVFSITHKFNISLEKLKLYNSGIEDGLKAYTTLFFPVEAFAQEGTALQTGTVPVGGQPVIRLVKIEKGQSLYGIAQTYKTTVDALLRLNPGLSANSYRAGDTIKVPVLGSDSQAPTLGREPVIQPAAEGTEGDIMLLSGAGTPSEPEGERIVAGVVDAPIDDVELVSDETVDNIEDEELTVSFDGDTLMITLMLPLELSSRQPSKTSNLYMDFYRGFLLGAEKLSHSDRPVKIKLIDSSVSNAQFEDILNNPDIMASDLFIGPEKEAQLTALASKIAGTDTYILNPFVIKEQLSNNNPSIIMLNIPRDEMYLGAVENFLYLFSDAIPVFIAGQADGDKASFVRQLKDRLRASQKDFVEISYTEELTPEQLEDFILSEDYVFIPNTASKAEFNKYVGTLKGFRGKVNEAGGEIFLFGFPEWTTMRKEALSDMKSLNTVIYSRFGDVGERDSRAIAQTYRKWFGGNWQDVEPNQALLGSDIAT